MKVIGNKNGKKTVTMSRKEWENIGKKAGWAAEENASLFNSSEINNTKPSYDSSKINFQVWISLPKEFEKIRKLVSYLQDNRKEAIEAVINSAWDQIKNIIPEISK